MRKVCPIAKIEQAGIMSVSRDVECPNTGKGNCNFLDADVPEKHRPVVMHLLQRNADLFAQEDSELSNTDTVNIKISTNKSKAL